MPGNISRHLVDVSELMGYVVRGLRVMAAITRKGSLKGTVRIERETGNDR